MLNEYLNGLIQFGFVALFSTALPLVPVLALASNVLELRRTARRFLCEHRRPVEMRVRSIGVVQTIMVAVCNVGVLTNACMIAFMSDFVPRFVYRNFNSADETLHGYVGSLLDVADVKDAATANRSRCHYAVDTGIASIGAHPTNVQTERHWRVLAFRLMFVVCFHMLVSVVRLLLEMGMSKQSFKTEMHMRQEQHVIKETIIEHEKRHIRTFLLLII